MRRHTPLLQGTWPTGDGYNCADANDEDGDDGGDVSAVQQLTCLRLYVSRTINDPKISAKEGLDEGQTDQDQVHKHAVLAAEKEACKSGADPVEQSTTLSDRHGECGCWCGHGYGSG